MTAFRVGATANREYLQAEFIARDLRTLCISAISAWAASNTSGAEIESMYTDLLSSNNEFERIRVIPGIAQAARDARQDQTYDVIDAFSDMQALLVTAGTDIFNSLPKDAQDRLTTRTISLTQGITYATYTPAETASIRTCLQNLVDGIVLEQP